MTLTETTRSLAAIALAALATGAAAQDDLTPARFGTNWVAQAEHGGFYQAVAEGHYADCGLDVEIVPGGPQSNNRALLYAGRLDFYMGGDLLGPFYAASRNIPSVMVAAMNQKHSSVILAHPGAAETWEDLRDLEILISDNAYQSIYGWMMSAHGFTAEQRRPYTFNPAPFLADEGVAMQGLLSSEPYLIEQTAGFAPAVFPIADHGFDSYATTIETMQATIDERPEVVQCFVDGSIAGWESYMSGDPGPGNDLILAANPEMTEEKIAYAIEAMARHNIVRGDDGAGIGAISLDRVAAFYEEMVAADVVEPGIDWRRAITTRFVDG